MTKRKDRQLPEWGEPGSKDPGVPGPVPQVLTQKELDNISVMAGYGLPTRVIATILGMGLTSLEDRIRRVPAVSEALEKGRASTEANTAQGLFTLAAGVVMLKEDGTAAKDAQGRTIYRVAPNLGAIIWIEKTRFGRSERSEVTGAGGSPLIPDAPPLSDDERAKQIAGILSLAEGRKRQQRKRAG